METERSLLHSQALATGPYPEPAQSSLLPPSLLKIHVTITFPSTPKSSS
jgi:hypothetical protein